MVNPLSGLDAANTNALLVAPFWPLLLKHRAESVCAHPCRRAGCCCRSAPNQVKVQLGEVFKTVVYADYPQAWPNLLQDMYACLASQV